MKTEERNIQSETIESLGKSRYFAMKWFTISYVLFLLPLTANFLMDSMADVDRIYRIINTPISLIGGVMFPVFSFKFMNMIKRINSSEYKQILNDEYYDLTTVKCMRNAFVAFILVMFVSIGVTALFPSVPAVVVCLIIALVVFLCGQISWLVYNR